MPVIVRGDGCYLEDLHGKRYLDALAGLFCVQIGYGFGEEMGEAAAAQMRELPFYINWTYAHPRAIELAAEIASARAGRPQPGVLRLRRLRGGRGGVEARPPVPRGTRRAALEGDRPPDRLPRNDDGSALDQRHPRSRRRRSSRSSRTRSTSGTRTATTVRRRRPRSSSPRFLLTDLEEAILGTRARDRGDGDHGAGAERGRLVHAAGRILAGRPRDLRPLRHPAVRRRGDHAPTAASAPGSARSATTSGPISIRPAKGLSSAYASIGAVVARDAIMEPFLEAGAMYAHGITFGGHPVQCGVALKNIEIMKRERIVEHVAENEDALPLDARAAPRPADRRRPARRRLLLRPRARQGQGDARDLQRRGVRVASARLPLAPPVRARPDLPRRRPRRPRDPDLAAARRGPGGVRRDHGNARRRPRGGLGADGARLHSRP